MRYRLLASTRVRCFHRHHRRSYSSLSRRGLVKVEPWRKGKTNKFTIDEEQCRSRIRQAVEELCTDGCRADINTYASLLQQCGNAGALAEGKRVHARILHLGLEADKLVANFLILMYGKCKSVDLATQVFERMPRRNDYSYSIMLQAFADCGQMRLAREVFDKMPLQADISWTALISGYAKNGFLEEAEAIFRKLPRRHFVAWTALVTAYAQNGQASKAFRTFQLMDLDGSQPDSIAFISVLDACATVFALDAGRLVHRTVADAAVSLDARVVNMLIHLYGRCGALREARSLFDKLDERNMPRRNLVSWNAMVTAYAENGRGKKALEIFRLMDLEGTQADGFTYLGSLDACSTIPDLAYGRLIHAEIRESRSSGDPKVGNALLNLYAKCGHLRDAVALFATMPMKILAAWNTMIGAFAQTGHGKEAIEVFEHLALEGLLPDEISFISVLSGCAYAGIFKDGLRIFVSITSDYGVTRVYDHFVCAVNILCQAGMLEEAEELADTMPFVTDAIPWMTLLAAAKVQNDMPRAARAGEKARKLNPNVSAPYVMLSSVYHMRRQQAGESEDEDEEVILSER
ncbi:hypothetical protein SELMODRAFT_79700 [Selaginella moellendorffii]|uniref:Pentatricopeptide repeat-containing protein-mitochondrial domain-containing protein n=1 Tax=Selaginella moellendorffii TaxID=88036 RepID=D8QWW2_SELML|nr:hypothetical protein SELMODRAFT_79700 [Selaginella moellendorffii]